MRSAAASLGLLVVLTAAPAWGNAPAAQPLTRDAVDSAASELRKEPSLLGTRSERRLRLKPSAPPPPPDKQPSEWTLWLVAAVQWLNETGRFLVWAVGALLLAVLLVRLRVLLRGSRPGRGPERLQLPTHVRDFDIRPQTLPPDVGAAALALWQAGQALAAMSLLYRGALSQLVHGHAVPIRSSSTEGDCLRLAAPRLGDGPREYLEALVSAWRSTVYGGRLPAEDSVRWLCAAFGKQMAPPPSAPQPAGAP